MDTATADADLDTPGTTGGHRPPGARPGEPRPGPPVPGAAGAQPTTLMSKKDTATGETVAARTGGPTSESGMQIVGNSGPDKPRYQVTLVVPPGGSTELKTFIGQAQSTIQQSVDVLGFGRSDPPPPPKNGKTPDKVRTLDLPQAGRGVDQYKQQVFSAGARQDTMVGMDAQVDGTSQMVAAEQAQTLFSIQHVVADLNTALRSVGSKKLKPAEEATIMDHVAAAVTKIHDKVQDAQNVNVGAAGGGSGGSAGGGGAAGGGAGAAGAAGGLGSMLPMLAMLPMALMPMLGQLPELLGQKDDEDDEDDKDDEARPGQPAPSPGPTPSDPTTTAPPDNAAPPQGDTPPQNQPPQTQSEIPYGPTPPSKQV
ncbi:hypothetical protein [Nocardia grenadensis]|uniref:hypothetical protein n=1 Tax=Nocardia grenadensis TaxID=931537 RepID=UPI000B281151|nr:hypothetical protein [Nocardia grenadensis]